MLAKTFLAERIKSSEPPWPFKATRQSCGPCFSLLELLVLVAMLAVLALTMVPALTRIRPAGDAIQCMTNAKRLVTAWQMYAQDNADRMIVPVTGGSHGVYGLGWAEGWLDWTTSTDNTNLNFLLSTKYSQLASYLSGTPNAFKCPADTYLSSAQRARGWTERARSYSANVGLGGGNAEVGPFAILYRYIKKTPEFQYPGPAETWVFVDEHPDSINDSAFFSPERQSWIDLPAIYHNGGASFSFADGHAEIHKWTGSLMRVKTVNLVWNPPIPTAGDPDIHWMSYHAQRRSTNSY
jgi:prepilin-type processing-associated H-X9-DG protein